MSNRPVVVSSNKTGVFSKYTEKEEDGDCVTWTGGRIDKRYGAFYDGENRILAHRYAYAAYIGELLPCHKVVHNCENSLCVNPEHLEQITTKEWAKRRRDSANKQWGDEEQRLKKVKGSVKARALRKDKIRKTLEPRTPMASLRKELWERAGYCCEHCGITEEDSLLQHGRRLALHHLDYSKTVPLLKDTLLVCCRCHGELHGNGADQDRRQKVMHAVSGLVQQLVGSKRMVEPDFLETPRRVADYLLHHFDSEDTLRKVLEDCSASVFPSEYSGMVVMKDIKCSGICPHHFLPVLYSISVAYMPQEDTIGLSKLVRLTEACAAIPSTQENVGVVLLNSMATMLGTGHVAAVLTGEHTCMTVRGVRAHGTKTVTSAVRGKFDSNEDGEKDEFLKLIGY